MMARPIVVLSDVHLVRGGDTPVTRAVASLLAAHPGHEVVLNGDTFNLSVEPPGHDVGRVLGELLTPKVELLHALREHLLRGAPVTFVAGNHDAALGLPVAPRALRNVLGVTTSAPLSCEPWFVRRGPVHIEHGHLYDADNAPNHPLVPPSPRTEPLGIAITRRFLVPQRALEFCHRYETTPMAGLRRVFALYGPRAPRVVLGYFAYAARQCRSTWHRRRIAAEQALGAEWLAEYAARQGVSAAALAELIACAPRPTHHKLSRTFARLYLDRVVASVGSVGGAAVLVAGAPMSGLLLAGAGTTYLGASLVRRRNRYVGVVGTSLRDAAARVVLHTGAEVVLMGHTHDEDATSHYVNTGSFAYPSEPGRPYVVVDSTGRVTRRRLGAADRAHRAA